MAALRLVAIDNKSVDPGALGQVLHAAMKLCQDALVDHKIRDLDVVDFQWTTQNRRDFEAEALAWPWSQSVLPAQHRKVSHKPLVQVLLLRALGEVCRSRCRDLR